VRHDFFVNPNQNIGKYGEDRAAQFFERIGYQIIDRNWRGAAGEIDIIAQDRECIVFAEVKTRTRRGYGHPFEAITAKKVQTMRRLAAQWCQVQQMAITKVRLDAVSVLILGGKVHIEHLKQVF
jgi:putative endonuclease